jgi:hypothetical protein
LFARRWRSRVARGVLLGSREPLVVDFSKRVASVVNRGEWLIFESLVSDFEQHNTTWESGMKSQRKLNCALFRHVSLKKKFDRTNPSEIGWDQPAFGPAGSR